MLGQPGTTPLDMFKLRVDDLQEELHQDKKAIREVFKVSIAPLLCCSCWAMPCSAQDLTRPRISPQDKDFEFTASTTAEEYMNVLQGDERAAKIGNRNMTYLFEYFLEKAQRHEKERKEREERRRRRSEKYFRRMLADKMDK